MYFTYICGVKSEGSLSTTKRDRVSSPVMLASRTLQHNKYTPVTKSQKALFSLEAVFYSIISGLVGKIISYRKKRCSWLAQ